jgi:hypothetical protein
MTCSKFGLDLKINNHKNNIKAKIVRIYQILCVVQKKLYKISENITQ